MPARPEVHFNLTSAVGAAPPAALDRFAPAYIVGNVLAGDSAVAYSTDGFVYIPDPGDGTGIETAIAFATGVPGSIWIRRGTYTKAAGQLRFTVPAGIRVWGEGANTIIIGSDADNCLWQLAAGAELAWMLVRHPGPLQAEGVGVSLIENPADGTTIHNLEVDGSLMAGPIVGGSLINYSGTGSTMSWSVLNRVDVLGPVTGGVQNPTDSFCCLRGHIGDLGLAPKIACSDVRLAATDAGIISLGNGDPGGSFHCTRVLFISHSAYDVYMDTATLQMDQCQVLAFSDTNIGSLILGAPESTLGDSMFLWLAVAAPTTPAVAIGSGLFAGDGSVNIHDCRFVGWGVATGVPATEVAQVELARGGDIARSAKVVNCYFSSALGVVPVILDPGCSNSLVALNASDGSGGVIALDFGAGNAPNVNNLWT
jgi:hypothetical protein